MEYLTDIKFLQEICSQKHQTIYSKVNLLDLEETPIQSLDGIVTGGSISLDGTSALARSCSLSLSTSIDSNFNSFLWSLESKVQIFIGVENNLQKYQDYKIIYFPMGIYYLNSFSFTENNSGCSISLQGKDKMIKLTGDLGGLFGATTDLGAIDIIDLINKSTKKESIPIKQIITELVHFYGHEPYEKIFVNDIDDYGLNLITYRGDDTLYYYVSFRMYEGEAIPYITNCRFSSNNLEIENTEYGALILNNPLITNTDLVSFNTIKNLLKNEQEGIKNIQLYTYNYQENQIKKYSIPNNEDLNYFDYLNELTTNNNLFMMGKYEYGDTIGYELTELIYPGDLVANPGESVTSVLDKIKKILGNYIYYYDIDGNFIFKKKNQYLSEFNPLNISFSPKNPDFFLTNNIIQSLSYSYNISNIKNDFIVWGQQKLSNGITTDIHARYAIDEKPQQYITLNVTEERAKFLIEKYPNLYYANQSKTKQEVISSLKQTPICYYEKEYTANAIEARQVDWREIIYQMALDYNKFNQTDEYFVWLGENNLQYQSGETGYERYYTDLLGFWRDLYQPYQTSDMYELQELKNDDNIKYNIKTVIIDKDNNGKPIVWPGTSNAIDELYPEDEQSTLEERKQLQIKFKLIDGPTLLELYGEKNVDQDRIDKFSKNEEYFQDIRWDIESNTFPNIQLYKKFYNQKSEQEEYVEVGLLNDIIKTNYKILGYMYYLLNPYVFWYKDNLSLIREDLNTGKKSIWNKSTLWRILAYNVAKKRNDGTKEVEIIDYERFNFYNNAAWSFQDGNKIIFLGAYYDITTLFFKPEALITLQGMPENSSISITIQGDSLSVKEDDTISVYNKNEIKDIYLQMTDYPKNKAGNSLTNIQYMEEDKMALLLWARANSILEEVDYNFREDGYNKKIFEKPDQLKFWFDFLSSDIFNQTYSVRNIGPREIVKKDTSVNCITSQAIPDLIFINPNQSIAKTEEQRFKIQQSYFRQARPNSTFLQLDLENGKKNTVAYTIKSAIDVIINLLYEHAIAPNSLTVSCIPQYYLKTDSIAWILDNLKTENKQYLINKISFALGHNGMMTINTQEFIDELLDKEVQRQVIIETK